MCSLSELALARYQIGSVRQSSLMQPYSVRDKLTTLHVGLTDTTRLVSSRSSSVKVALDTNQHHRLVLSLQLYQLTPRDTRQPLECNKILEVLSKYLYTFY